MNCAGAVPRLLWAPATVTIKAGDSLTSTGLVSIAPVQPGLFTFNTDGLIAGNILRFPTGGGDPAFEEIFTLDSAGNISRASRSTFRPDRSSWSSTGRNSRRAPPAGSRFPSAA